MHENADNPKDAKLAKELGAEGIGLCRTEHMFFDKQRIRNVQKMILSNQICLINGAQNDYIKSIRLINGSQNDYIKSFCLINEAQNDFIKSILPHKWGQKIIL